MFMTFIGIGIPWYSREDYSRIRAIMEDGAALPRSYAAWVKITEELECKLAAEGRMPQRAHLHSDKFTIWCSVRGLARNRLARTKFAADSSNWVKQS